METRERKEQLLALKVMRLSRPTLYSPMVVTCDNRDLPGNLFNADLKNDLASVQGLEMLSVGQFLLLPQGFGNIYLGETFCSYVCVHNISGQNVFDACVKCDLQTASQRITLSGNKPEHTVAELRPQQSLDQVIHYDVKEIGTHMLICEVSYQSASKERFFFQKFFKFQVLKPLDIRTKFYNVKSDEVFLEAEVQNITGGPICLEKVSLESSHLFTVTPLNKADGTSLFGPINILPPQSSCQFLYCLAPRPDLQRDLRLLRGATNIGKLDIIWRSNLGERGRLQTSQLHCMAPDHRDIHLAIAEIPNIVTLEEPFTFSCRLTNTSDRIMDLVLGLDSRCGPGLSWSGISGRQLERILPGESILLPLRIVPMETGLQSISGVRLTDIFSKKVQIFDDLAQVFVVQKY